MPITTTDIKANKPAHPKKGDRYYTTDTTPKEVDHCFADDAWTQIIPGSGGGADHSVAGNKTAAQAIGPSLDTDINFDVVDYDTDAYELGAPFAFVTVPAGKAGKYQVNAEIEFAADATGSRRIMIAVNGANKHGTHVGANADAAQPTIICVSQEYNLAVGDTVRVRGFQTTAGGLNVTGGRFTMRKVDKAG